MSRSRKLRIFVPLIVAAALALPSASAESRQKRDRTPCATTSLWNTLTSIWAAIGCKLDPHGSCVVEQPAPPPETDIGCKIDPNGGCAPES